MRAVPDLSAYVRSGPSGSSPARSTGVSAPRVATASIASTRGATTSAQRTNPLSAFDTRDVSLFIYLSTPAVTCAHFMLSVGPSWCSGQLRRTVEEIGG